jgi:hypothetical protein
MARTITLKYEANCKDCGAHLAAGTLARYYGRGKVYGTDCHEQKPKRANHRPRPLSDHESETWSRAKQASHYDPTGFYNAAGELIGRTNANGRCEDAPCCGCCQ